MKHLLIRKIIRKIICEQEKSIEILGAKQVGLDHLNRFKVNLSDGSVDYIDKRNAIILNSRQADYKCATISGLIKSDSNLEYEFKGVNCDGYIWIDSNSLKLINSSNFST